MSAADDPTVLAHFNESAGGDGSSLEEYGRFQQHLVLLEDKRRIEAYAMALGSVPPGEVVVDVGAGSGILSMMALKAGYQHAYLIEPSRKMALYAKHLASLNGFEERVTIVNSTLEALSMDELPKRIDMVVTETISSLLFGFGSWDALPRLVDRTHDQSSIIPVRGRLFAALVEDDVATRGRMKGGLQLLERLGLQVDLYERTFRSGGNIYDSREVSDRIAKGSLVPAQIASFDFGSPHPINLSGGEVGASATESFCGIVLYWEVDLCDGAAPTSLSNLDENLSSWHPLYVPFIEPLHIEAGEALGIRMELKPIDAPYKYAFQFFSGKTALSNVLYW